MEILIANPPTGTLVERQTRYVKLLHLPHGRGAKEVERAMRDAGAQLPASLAKQNFVLYEVRSSRRNNDHRARSCSSLRGRIGRLTMAEGLE